MNSCRCDRFYDLPQLIGKNSPKAAIGYGCKEDVVRKSAVPYPSPNKYSIKSIFDECKKGYGFRLGRQVKLHSTQKLKHGSIFTPSSTPGPGAYQSPETRLTPEITMKPRLKEMHDSSYRNPGPGACKPINNLDNIPKFLADNGRYTLSTLRNTSTPTLKNVLSKGRKPEVLPGPGSYQTKQNFNPNGTYFNAKFHNSCVKSFGKVERDRPLSKHLPNIGPGAYQHQTDFGARERA